MSGYALLFLFGWACWLMALVIFHMAHARDLRDRADRQDRVFLPPRYRGFGS